MKPHAYVPTYYDLWVSKNHNRYNMYNVCGPRVILAVITDSLRLFKIVFHNATTWNNANEYLSYMYYV